MIHSLIHLIACKLNMLIEEVKIYVVLVTVFEAEIYFYGWGGWVGGWVAGEEENKAISAFIEVEVEVEAELGNMLG